MLTPYDGDSAVWELRKNLTRVSVWRKQEDNFLSEYTPFPGRKWGLKKKSFVSSVTDRSLCSDDHICLYKPEHRPLIKINPKSTLLI